jgi:O-antigen/teichoic acid export membrane protein
VTFNVVNSFARLIFPLFSRDQHDPIRLRDLFLRSAASLTVFVSFCGWGLVATAPELVRVIAGPQWEPLNNPLLLQAVCLPLLITTGIGAAGIFLCSALNRSYVWSVHSILLTAFSATTFFVVGTGPTRLMLGFAVAQVLASLYVIGWSMRTLQLNAWALIRRLSIPLAIGIVCGMTTVFLKLNFAAGAPWQRLLVAGTFFVALYVITAWLFDRETGGELRRLIRRKQPLPEET